MSATTLDRRMESLAEANRRRIRQADTKRRIAALPRPQALQECAHLVELDPPDLGAMTVRRLVTSVRGVGPERLRCRLLPRHLLVLADRRLQDLSARQRSMLADAIRSYARRA